MSKKSRELRRELKSNMYENDYEELIYSTSIDTKLKHIQKTKERKPKEITKEPSKEKSTKEPVDKSQIFGNSISTKSVSCKCNKCGHHLYGTLVSIIFTAATDTMTPFISYSCENCHTSGFRSVKEKAMVSKEFEKYYF